MERHKVSHHVSPKSVDFLPDWVDVASDGGALRGVSYLPPRLG
uniref:Uncharacterized protein n=1 Tax=uncultured bacterium A1Q1_fos_962 TaxID=1256592 RepID=L7VYL3_9BACT|nr:hypothetical protein [uncultured bacterium A1Q1_fos_962]